MDPNGTTAAIDTDAIDTGGATPTADHPPTTNLVVLRGLVTTAPRTRELPSGDVITHLDVATCADTRRTTVPVAVHGRTLDVGAGDDVVVIGHVHRRFFRVGGVTQSRTEVVATRLIRARRRSTVRKLLAGVSEHLCGDVA